LKSKMAARGHMTTPLKKNVPSLRTRPFLDVELVSTPDQGGKGVYINRCINQDILVKGRRHTEMESQ
jgi:hypothetical protein